MILPEDKNHVKQIVCDKCGIAVPYDNHSLFTLGWTVNSKAKKYIHLCYYCKSKKQKESFNFVKSKFF